MALMTQNKWENQILIHLNKLVNAFVELKIYLNQ